MRDTPYILSCTVSTNQNLATDKIISFKDQYLDILQYFGHYYSIETV